MVIKWKKFIEKHPFRDIINHIIKDIETNNLEQYFIKPLSGYTQYFRIRKGNIRIVFEKTSKGNNIVAVDTRGQIYRGLK